jgi:hypothetical protein
MPTSAPETHIGACCRGTGCKKPHCCRERKPGILFRALLWVGALRVATVKRARLVCDERATCRRDGSVR